MLYIETLYDLGNSRPQLRFGEPPSVCSGVTTYNTGSLDRLLAGHPISYLLLGASIRWLWFGRNHHFRQLTPQKRRASACNRDRRREAVTKQLMEVEDCSIAIRDRCELSPGHISADIMARSCAISVLMMEARSTRRRRKLGGPQAHRSPPAGETPADFVWCSADGLGSALVYCSLLRLAPGARPGTLCFTTSPVRDGSRALVRWRPTPHVSHG